MDQNDALGRLGELLTTPAFRGSFARNPLDALRDAGVNPQDIDPGVLSALSELTAAELRVLAQVGHALRESGVDAPTALRMVQALPRQGSTASLTAHAPSHRAGTASARLRHKIEFMTPPYADACRRLIGHPRIAEVFPEYLVGIHCIIRTTVPLMDAAVERAKALSSHDEVAALVGPYLEKHVEEERHHDDWLLDDLEVLGLDRRAVLRRVPTAAVAALAGSQYYWVLHYHPVALLGYLAFMEGSPPTPKLIDDLRVRTGHPHAAFRTLVKHGELDPGHSEEIDRVIDSLPLAREHETVLGLSAMSSAGYLTRALEEVLEVFS